MKLTNSTLGLPGIVRSRRICLNTLFALFTGASCCLATSEDVTLIRVSTRSGSHVGELINDDAANIEFFDLESNRTVSLSKSAVTRLEKPITLDDAARYVGLPSVIGRRISLLSDRPVPKGKIAKITPQIVYLTLGKSSGVVKGQKVAVFRDDGVILDPDTGEVLANERARIAELEISEVSQRVSKAKFTGDFEVKLEVGDVVEPQRTKVIVAVCPPSNDDGSFNATGIGLAEELVGALVQRKVSVVERSALDMVLSELLSQNTILFDQKSAQRLGELTGASMVLTGKIIPERSSGKAHLRLIDVKTGKILIAVSATVRLNRHSSGLDSAARGAPMLAGNASTKRNEVRQPSGRLEKLGSSKSLPSYLTTTAALGRTSDGGVKILGVKMHHDYDTDIIATHERNFLDRNFVFEVLVTFRPDDGTAHIGIGSGRQDGAANRRADSVFMRFHAPHHGEGHILVESWKNPTVKLGSVPQKGVHLVRITKTGDALTFEVDPENDGPTDDDMETVIPNLREHAPYLNSKNCHLFLGGTSTFVATRLQILP